MSEPIYDYVERGKVEALTSERDALAAENARLREGLEDHFDLWHPDEHGDAEWRDCDYPECEAARALVATPAAVGESV